MKLKLLVEVLCAHTGCSTKAQTTMDFSLARVVAGFEIEDLIRQGRVDLPVGWKGRSFVLGDEPYLLFCPSHKDEA